MNRSKTRQEVIESVVRAKTKSINSSFLIKAIPGADEPRPFLKRVKKQLDGNFNDKILFAFISTDSIDSQQELVEKAIRLWCSQEHTLQKAWAEELQFEEASKPATLLKSFCGIAEDEGLKLCLLIDKFHKLFRHMSSSLLGTMRNLDHDNVLSFINISEAGYQKLYSIRSRQDPSFTSDYGQIHSDYTLRRYTVDEARNIWSEQLGISGDLSAESNRLFKIAFYESGGFPVLFQKATRLYLENPNILHDNFPGWLLSELSSAFAKIIDQIELFEELPFVESLASIATETVHRTDIDRLTSNKRAHLFINENENGFSLACKGLGIAALKKVCKGKRSYGSPESIYKMGYYNTCINIAGENANHTLLCIAARLMNEVYGDRPTRRLFKPSVVWDRVSSLAQEAISNCSSPEATIEFKHWRTVAEAFKNCPRNSPQETAEYFGSLKDTNQTEITNATYLLGARYCAAKSEEHPTQSAYLALPLLEGIICCCLALYVEQLGGETDALNCISEEMVQTWKLPDWKDKKAPNHLNNLGAAKACFILAILSHFVDEPIFEDVSALHKTIGFFGSTRNPLAHNVIEVDPATATSIMETIETIWGKTIEVKLSISISQVTNMLSPPTLFLKSI